MTAPHPDPYGARTWLDQEADRRAAGRAARDRMPRRDLAHWDPTTRRHDPLHTVLDQNAIRVPDLVALRHGRMAVSPWTYYRGAAAVMAADLGRRPHSGLTVQLCGDAHILNFGLWATPERRLAFDLRDFDETSSGPFEWDVIRLVASIHVLARQHGVTPKRAERAVAACLKAYRSRMADYTTAKQLDIWYDRITVADLIALFSPEDRERATNHIDKQAEKRTGRRAFHKLTAVVDGHLKITEEPPRRVRLDDDRLRFDGEVFAAYRSSLQSDRRYLLDHFTYVDSVRQVVGVGSVGMRVSLVLLEGRDGADPLFLQIKQAGPSVYEPYSHAPPPTNNGQRVVEGKRLIQSATDIFVGWTTVDGLDFYVRQFRDMKVIPDGDVLAPRLAEFAGACGAVLARSHARTGDPIAIKSYIGNGRQFDDALGEFAIAYADQTERDHREFAIAASSGVIPSVTE